MSDEKLPASWALPSISDCCELNPKIDKSRFTDAQSVHFVPMSAVEALINKVDVTATRTFAEVKKGYTPFQSGDVIFAKITPCMENGKIAAVPNLPHKLAFGSTEFHVIRPLGGLHPFWFFYYLSSRTYRSNAEHNMTGAVGQRRVPIDFIARSPIPLPPLPEQKRIVAKIEELFSELEAGEESLRTARRQLGVYRQSLLKQAFEGKLTAKWRTQNADKLESPAQLLARIQSARQSRYEQRHLEWEAARSGTKPKKPAPLSAFPSQELINGTPLPAEWLVLSYGDLCSVIRNGISQKPAGNSGHKIARISAVRPMVFDYSDYRFIDCADEIAADYTLADGDLIFTRYNGARRFVGVCAQFKGKEPRLYPDKLIRTRPDLPLLDPRYLEIALNCGLSRAWLETRIRTTAGQSGVSGGDVKAMPVPLCSLPEQQEIVRLLDEQFEVIERNEREIDSALKRSEALRQAILKKAFTGGLVPQDPADEPASVLLARLRAEREAIAGAKGFRASEPSPAL